MYINVCALHLKSNILFKNTYESLDKFYSPIAGDEQEMLQSSIYRGDDPFTVYTKIPTVNDKFTTNSTILVSTFL
jgi:hypothetical protein